MKEEILKILNNGSALTLNDIANKLKTNDTRKVSKVLDDLVDNLEVYITRKNKYTLFQNCKLRKGSLMIKNDSTGIVTLEDYEQVYITQRDLHGAKDGDIVAIEITNKKGSELYGRVVKIKKRDNKRIVGELVLKKDYAYIRPDTKENFSIFYDGPTVNLVDGMKVIVELTDKLNQNTYDSRIIEVIGHKDDPNIDMLSLLRLHNINIDFPNEVLKEIEEIPNEVTEEEIIECLNRGGEDLRDERTVTIDGDDTKDFDDAITIKKIGNLYDLKVSIANVSNYVKVDTNMFTDAIRRGTSVYIPGSSIPMLPRKLSNGICSLNPNVDRLALTFEMLIDLEGNVVDFSIYDSIINSKMRMTYSNVNKILEEGIVPEGYEEYLPDLKIMEELHKILRKKKIDRGYIDFEIDENNIHLDKDGKPVDITYEKRGTAEKIIEDFMVQTGESASHYLDSIETDTHIYRIHGEPNEEKVEKLRNYLTLLGCNTDRLNNLSPKNMQLLLEQLKSRKEYLIIARELLKCMQKAIYSTKNIGHFASASPSTCQVTSPIRRAGDLVNHILIRENIYHTGVGSINDKMLSYMANHASVTERNAASCEMKAKKMKAAEYMLEHVGEEFEGMITHVNANGMYVELPNLIEGFIDINSLNGSFKYYEERFAIISKSLNKRYFLGDKIKVVVKGANKQEGIVIFDVSGSVQSKRKVLSKKK